MPPHRNQLLSQGVRTLNLAQPDILTRGGRACFGWCPDKTLVRSNVARSRDFSFYGRVFNLLPFPRRKMSGEDGRSCQETC